MTVYYYCSHFGSNLIVHIVVVGNIDYSFGMSFGFDMSNYFGGSYFENNYFEDSYFEDIVKLFEVDYVDSLDIDNFVEIDNCYIVVASDYAIDSIVAAEYS
jgi:hypothetical protein